MIEEKKMFGGLCFLLRGHLLVGVWKDSPIARVSPGEGEAARREPYVQPFDITGRPMRAWVLVGPDEVEEDDRLTDWIDRATAFVVALPAK
jgi:hypothetical protein